MRVEPEEQPASRHDRSSSSKEEQRSIPKTEQQEKGDPNHDPDEQPASEEGARRTVAVLRLSSYNLTEVGEAGEKRNQRRPAKPVQCRPHELGHDARQRCGIELSRKWSADEVEKVQESDPKEGTQNVEP